jgi:hypothetical protein
MVNAWYDNTGLYRKYGTDKATPHIAGEYCTYGDTREVEVTLTLPSLGSSASIVDDTVVIPAGARIEEVSIVAHTAATSSGSAVLNIGLSRTDRTTELDYDGLVAALAKTAYDAAGEKTTINVGSTGAGALIGTTLAYTGHITADYDTAAFTAGVIRVRIRYYMP